MKKSSNRSSVRYARYTRVSSSAVSAGGHKRQLAAIDKSLQELGMHWFHVGDCSDCGVPGQRSPKLVDILKRLFKGFENRILSAD
jgi:hypothetical protein